MAKPVEHIIVGVDTAKDELETYRADLDQGEAITNAPKSVDRFLASLPRETSIAIESTGRLHELLMGKAFELGMKVYLIDARQLSNYREATRGRAKTDKSDARLLARFLEREGADLRPANPRSKAETRLWQLLRRRACVVHARTSMKLSLQDVDIKIPGAGRVIAQIDKFIKGIEDMMLKLVDSLGWGDDFARLLTIPGVGRLTALGLLMTYRRAPFRSSDAFIAFMGMDVRVRDSGNMRGKRRLTKKGDPEIRRLLFLAGRSARMHHERFTTYFERLVGNGQPRIGADLAVGRKIARIAYALLRDQKEFLPMNA